MDSIAWKISELCDALIRDIEYVTGGKARVIYDTCLGIEIIVSRNNKHVNKQMTSEVFKNAAFDVIKHECRNISSILDILEKEDL